MKRALAVLSILLALGGAAAAQGQKPKAPTGADQGGGPVVAVVDVQFILREAAAAKAVRQMVEARRADFEKELEQEAQALRAVEEELRREQSRLEPAALAGRRQELEQRFAELRRQTEERRGSLNQSYNAAMRQIRQEMARALAEIMGERKIDISMSRTAVLIFDEKLDITKDVLARLNKRLPKAEVRFAPTAPQPQN